MEKFRIRMAVSLLAAFCLIGMTACSQQTASSAAVASGTSASGASAGAGEASGGAASGSADQTAVFGKVTAVDGSKITLALGTLKNSRPSGAASGSGRPERIPPAGSRAASGSRPAGQGADMLTLSGKTETITISDAGVIKKFGRPGQQGQSGGNASSSGGLSASLSEIQVGTILRVSKGKDGALSSVMILGGSGSRSGPAKN